MGVVNTLGDETVRGTNVANVIQEQNPIIISSQNDEPGQSSQNNNFITLNAGINASDF